MHYVKIKSFGRNGNVKMFTDRVHKKKQNSINNKLIIYFIQIITFTGYIVEAIKTSRV